MHHAQRIYTKGTSITLFTLVLICFLISCKYEYHDPCLDRKDTFNATIAEYGTATNHFSSEPCNIGFYRSVAGDSLTLSGGGSYYSNNIGNNFGITLLLINIKSTGEYAFGIESVPGEPWVLCKYQHNEGWNSHFYSTDEELGPWVGSGMLTIDNLSTDYISGTFHAKLYDFYLPPSDPSSNMTEITSGSFSFSLK